MSTFLVYNPMRYDGIVVATYIPKDVWVGNLELIPALTFKRLPDRVKNSTIFFAGVHLGDKTREEWASFYNAQLVDLIPSKPMKTSVFKRIINWFKKES